MVAEDRLGLVTDEEDDELEAENIFYEPDSVIQKQSSPGLLYLASVSAAIGGVIFGYDVGVIAGARSQVRQECTCTVHRTGFLGGQGDGVDLHPGGAAGQSDAFGGCQRLPGLLEADGRPREAGHHPTDQPRIPRRVRPHEPL